jgi:hypothetical protein
VAFDEESLKTHEVDTDNGFGLLVRGFLVFTFQKQTTNLNQVNQQNVDSPEYQPFVRVTCHYLLID